MTKYYQTFLARVSKLVAGFKPNAVLDPAMQAGISDHVWTLEEIAKLAE